MDPSVQTTSRAPNVRLLLLSSAADNNVSYKAFPLSACFIHWHVYLTGIKDELTKLVPKR